MGTLSLPPSGLVCVDTQILIYTVEVHPLFSPLVRPLWEAAREGSITIIASDLTVAEVMVLPFRTANMSLLADYEQTLFESDLRLTPIDHTILRESARLRAGISGLRVPDAIHAATAICSGAVMFLTNDEAFRRVPGLRVAVLKDHAIA